MTDGKKTADTEKSTRRTASATALSTSLLPRQSGPQERRTRVPLIRHPLVHFLLFLLLGGGVGCAVAALYSAFLRSAPADAAVGPEEPAFPDIPALTIDDNLYNEAVELYRRALVAQGEERLRVLRQLAQRFPGSPEGKRAALEVAKLDASLKKKAETKAVTPATPTPTAKIPGKPATPGPAPAPAKPAAAAQTKPKPPVIAEKPTAAAIKAPVPATSTTPATPAKPAVAATTPKPQPKPPAPVVEKPEPAPDDYEFAYDNSTKTPLNIFIQRYHDALKDWNLDEAGRLADSLSKSQKYPQIRNFGRACAQDVQELKNFDQTLRQQLEKQKGKEIQLVLAKGSKLTGNLAKFEGNKVVILVNNRFPQQTEFPLSLNPDYLFTLYFQAKAATPDTINLLKGLFCLAADDEFAARNFLGQLPAQDSRNKMRELILQQAYGEQ